MAEKDTLPAGPRLVYETRLDAPPDTVRRALTEPALRSRWLPDAALADAAPIAGTPENEVHYRVADGSDDEAPSVVAFTLRPDADGGTVLRIVHAREPLPLPAPANANTPVMRAA